VPSPDHQIPDNRGIDWPAVVRILLLQVLVLLALAGAFIAYVNWSSERAFSEFVGASEVVPLAPYRQPQYWASIRAVKGQASCKR
jgi:hypothetical protein